MFGVKLSETQEVELVEIIYSFFAPRAPKIGEVLLNLFEFLLMSYFTFGLPSALVITLV